MATVPLKEKTLLKIGSRLVSSLTVMLYEVTFESGDLAGYLITSGLKVTCGGAYVFGGLSAKLDAVKTSVILFKNNHIVIQEHPPFGFLAVSGGISQSVYSLLEEQ